MRGGRFPEISDDQVVLAALLGDLEALDELVRRFRVAVTLVAEQTLGRKEGAEDVAQEAFLLAFKALPQLQEPSRFAGWLCAITRHRARRVGSRERRSEATEPSEMDRLLLTHSRELAASPAEEYARTEERTKVSEALATLEPDYRTALRLYYYEEWPVARIADFLSLPITTVKWRLHQGRELLRRRLIEPQEEPNHDRGKRQPRGNPPPAPPAQGDSRSRRARQPDGQPEARRAQRGASLQPGA